MRGYFPLLFLISALACVAAPQVRHGVVFHDAAHFSGWPANEGSWVWGDEMLVGFETARYAQKNDDHSLDRDTARLALARSLDGGKTWAVESPANFAYPIYMEDTRKGGTSHHAKILPVPLGGVGNMADADFIFKTRGDVFYVSHNRGRDWRGPYALPRFPEHGATPAARTSYLVTGMQSALFFMSSVGERTQGEQAERGRAYVMKTEDGCQSFQFVGWMSPDLEASASAAEKAYPVFSLMPSVVRLDGARFVAALRERIHKRKWTKMFVSEDNAKTWSPLGVAEEGANNPPALVKLKDGKTLALVYGFRGRRCGIAAKLSEDGGKTWGAPVVLRDDAKTWDMGYPRAHVLDNGDVMVFYYYNTEARPQPHIAWTRWTPCAAPASRAADATVYYDPEQFAGWPANEGSWAWGDEILTAFNTDEYEEKTDTHSHKNPRLQTAFARSFDGGKTWTSESHPEMTFGAPVPYDGADDMTAEGFAMKLRGRAFFVTHDKGHTWQGPYTLPAFEKEGAVPNARTSYIVTGTQSALFFMTTRSERAGGAAGERGRAYVMATDDGCRTFRFLSWMGEDLTPRAKAAELKAPVFSIMPSVVRLDGNRYLAALRQRIDRRKWTDIYESKDGCKTWRFIATAERGANNPPALVKLKDGKTLALFYGYRAKPFGLRARLSTDDGRTWGRDIVLRDDAKTWDLGYPRAHVLPDGTVATLYYYNTPERPQQHIACTRWNP